MAALYHWAKSSPADDFWLVFAITVLLAVAGFFAAFYFFSRKRTMENTPTSKIRSAAQGYVELQGRGKLLDGPPIIGPLTGRHCTWYSFQVQERRKSNNKTSWVTIEKGVSDQLFLIVDDTGKCVIDPEGASVTATVTDRWYGNNSRPTTGPGASRGFLNLRTGRYMYTEKRLHPGEQLYAIGLFNTVGGAGGEFDVDSGVKQLLQEWKRDSDSLLQRFDSNRDGEIDMQEWQAVRRQALSEVMAKHNEMQTAPPVNMLTRTRDRRRPFLLSAVPQEVLARRLGYWSAALILLFFSAGAFAVWILNVRMSVA